MNDPIPADPSPETPGTTGSPDQGARTDEQSAPSGPAPDGSAPDDAAPQETASPAPHQDGAEDRVSADDRDRDEVSEQDPDEPAGDREDSDAEAESDESTEERLRRLEEEGDIAADYLEELLDIGDLDGDIDIDVDGDRASVEVRGATRLARLNHPKGELLDALQELTRLAVQTRTGNRSRLMLDIGGFRAQHKGDLEELAAEAATRAKDEGVSVPLRAMNPFERKVVHDVAKQEGLHSESDGDGKDRHVVIYPAS